jgi:KipI family sensor histidine kinase inhibitor
MIISSYGDSAVLINFEQKINKKINTNVELLSKAITSALIDGVTFCIPAYCSLTVGFDPRQIQYDHLVNKINAIELNIAESGGKLKSRIINIPVCYQGDFAIDKTDVIAQTKLSWEEIVEVHTSMEYRVYMLGFIAGFAYMGTLPEVLVCNRKAAPRKDIPSGTVGIAGLQTGIYPAQAHAGWQLIGRTPVPVFDIHAKSPFLFRTGDRVQFRSIEPELYATLTADIASGKFNISSVITNA